MGFRKISVFNKYWPFTFMKLTPEQKLAQIYLIMLAYNEGDVDEVKAVKSIKKIVLQK